MVIDGYTQPGASANTLAEGDNAVLLIVVSGASASAGTNGLTINTNNSTIRGLVINGFQTTGTIAGGLGVLIGGNLNVVEGSFIGTNAAGSSAAANFDGVEIVNASDNLIGGATPASRNLVSGNSAGGVVVTGSTALRNLVKGNYIGTNAGGTAAVGNSAGIVLGSGTTDTVVGGTTTSARNIISGNTASGVFFDGSLRTPQRSPIHTLVQGNYIGLNAAGTAAIANLVGVDMYTTKSNTIGGTAAGAGNVISGNTREGVLVDFLFICCDGLTEPNLIQGNLIGTNPAGNAGIGNGGDGVSVFETFITLNTIGGNTAGARNVVSGNGANGIKIEDAFLTLVQGNYIGTTIGLAPLGNAGHGVLIAATSTGNHIGDTTTGSGNVIAHNTLDGISMTGTGTVNTFSANSIYGNGGLGIDLGDDGVTANDAGDSDTGSNNLQNFPVLTSAITSGATTTIQGTLNSVASQQYTIQFFANNVCDASGHGEGETWLGDSVVTTDVSGNAIINAPLTTVAPGLFITSTATNGGGDTSEFSACQVVAPASIPCTLTCPSNITQPATTGQCRAVVNYPVPTGSGTCGSVVCSPAAGSFFSVGTTTVNCSIAGGPSCSFTVTVTDTQAPTITCAANIDAAVSPGLSCSVVNYPAPTATDNCSGVTTTCVPASGSCFPLGTTTVMCTAKDAANNTKACSFTIKVSMFDTCIQDDTDPSKVLVFSSTTGDYVFCGGAGLRMSGRGTVTKRGGEIALDHYPSDRRLQASVSMSAKKGSASLQMPAGVLRCTIIDRDVTNNSCNCAATT